MNSELLRVVKTDNTQALDVVLKKNAPINRQRDENGNTPLLLAAANGHLSMVQNLIENANVSLITKNNFGSTALLLAAANGHIPVVQYLLENTDSKITEKNYYGDTALLLAAAYGHIPMTVYLLENTDAKITEQNQNGSTPLLAAAAYGHVPMVKYLLENTASHISERSHSGYTALLIAASYGHIALLKYLLEHTDSHISERSNSGSTALLLAAYHGHIGMVDYLLNQTDSKITECNHHGNTALLLAAYNGQIPMLEFLLTKPEVSLSEKNKNTGDNALNLAAWNGHIETVRFLLNQGIPIDLLRQDGRTALEIIQGHPNTSALPILEAAEKLLRRCETNDAHFKETTEELLTLLGTGIHGKKRITGNTALHFAIQNNQIDLVRVLLENNAKLDIPNLKFETPLTLALESDNPHLTAMVCLAKIKQLCSENEASPLSFRKTSTTVLGISESKEESKELKENELLKENQCTKALEDYLQIILDTLFKTEEDGYFIPECEGIELIENLIGILSNSTGSFYRPHIAYEILSKINKKWLTAKHHAIMYELLQSDHLLLQPSHHKDEFIVFLKEGPIIEDESSKTLLLRKKIEHLSQSDFLEPTFILNELITEYIGLNAFPMIDIKNNPIESMFILMDALKEEISQNKQFLTDVVKQKNGFLRSAKKNGPLNGQSI